MRRTVIALLLVTAAPAASAQDATIAAPSSKFGKYDPTMSAKEAVLANWELAASGIRAGEVLGQQVVALADKGASFGALSRKAAFAQSTMLSRYFAASWAYMGEPEISGVEEATLRAMVAATSAECAGDACEAERAAIRAAFAQGSLELGAAAADARAAIDARQSLVDATLMNEQLGVIADYLDSGAWAEDLVLTEFGMDGEVVADRIVGAMALWGNVEPYVGLTSPEIDDAINAAARDLLRTLRRHTRDADVLDADGPELAEITAAADNLAAEFRRASALFSS